MEKHGDSFTIRQVWLYRFGELLFSENHPPTKGLVWDGGGNVVFIKVSTFFSIPQKMTGTGCTIHTTCFFTHQCSKKHYFYISKWQVKMARRKRRKRRRLKWWHLISIDIYCLSSPDAGSVNLQYCGCLSHPGSHFPPNPWMRGRKTITDFWKHQSADRKRIKQKPYNLLVLGMWLFWLFFQMHVNFNPPCFLLGWMALWIINQISWLLSWNPKSLRSGVDDFPDFNGVFFILKVNLASYFSDSVVYF